MYLLSVLYQIQFTEIDLDQTKIISDLCVQFSVY